MAEPERRLDECRGWSMRHCTQFFHILRFADYRPSRATPRQPRHATYAATHLAMQTPGKLVLPPISPYLSSRSQMMSSDSHSAMDTSSGAMAPHGSTLLLAGIRTPTSVTQPPLSYFGSALTSSSPVKKECKKPTPASPLDEEEDDHDHDHDAFAMGDEKLRLSRERNRLHAQRTRIRKRELLESLKDRIANLQKEHELLIQAYEFHSTAVCLLSLGNHESQKSAMMTHLERYCQEECVTDFIQQQKAQHVQIEMEVDADTLAMAEADRAASGDEMSKDHDHEESCALFDADANGCCSCSSTTLNANGKRLHPHALSLSCTKEEREKLRRERNRLHARRARLRKKLILEKSQQAVEDLRVRNDHLRERLNALVSCIYGPRSMRAIRSSMARDLAPSTAGSALSLSVEDIDSDEGLSELLLGSEDSEIDVNLEEDVLQDIRALVKKEKLLNQLRAASLDSDSDVDDELASDRDSVDSSEKIAESRSPRSPRKAWRSAAPLQEESFAEQPTLDLARGTNSTTPTPEAIAKQHRRLCFVEPNPVGFQAIQHLELSSQELAKPHLQRLMRQLYLFTALRTVNLADNQLDDSCTGELRTLLSTNRLQGLDLSRNLLGRWCARTICDRLQHQIRLKWLDLRGNLFFTQSDALDMAQQFAQAVLVNEFMMDLCISVPEDASYRPVLLAPSGSKGIDLVPERTHQRSNNSAATTDRGASDRTQTPAHMFTYELALGYHARKHPPTTIALSLSYAELSRKSMVHLMKVVPHLTVLDLAFAFIGIPGAQVAWLSCTSVLAAALQIKNYASLTQLNVRGNRMRSKGCQAILAALCTNERLTDVNMSRNEMQPDVVADLVRLFRSNRVLFRLDLSKNAIIPPDATKNKGNKETSQPQALLTQWIENVCRHRAIQHLGHLETFCQDDDFSCDLHDALEHNRRQNDLTALDAVNDDMEREQRDPVRRKPTVFDKPVIVTLGPFCPTIPVWQRSLSREARASLKWKMRAIVSKGESSHDEQAVVIEWSVVVYRRCQLHDWLGRGKNNEVVAKGSVGTGGGECSAGCRNNTCGFDHVIPVLVDTGYELQSAVAYAREDDVVSLEFAFPVSHADDPQSVPIKVFVRNIVMVEHQVPYKICCTDVAPLDRHVAYRMSTLTQLCWFSKRLRLLHDDPLSFMALVHSVDIHAAADYRANWTIAFPTRNTVTPDFLQTFRWQLSRSSIWNPSTSDVLVDVRPSHLTPQTKALTMVMHRAGIIPRHGRGGS
ncbi:TPA: hypothetical protein N0F65_008765 [Lagenidium giganteum]|uniref:BZIP domain-containing protein n=1 Tax=Lagenidium giganteum TaxID=4803 RepID=A0AAV2Z315_9STRA|nr:TPA: hypothetical protein N0F65_008765 [Lagenidium giganteum]